MKIDSEGRKIVASRDDHALFNTPVTLIILSYAYRKTGNPLFILHGQESFRRFFIQFYELPTNQHNDIATSIFVPAR